jgi:hypothetical protein
MKTIKYIIFINILIFGFLVSCVQEDFKIFEGKNRLEFIGNDNVIKISQSFTDKFSFKKIKIKNKEVEVDTVFLTVRTIGEVDLQKNRRVSIKQIIEKDKNGKELKNIAKPGIHYIAFDNQKLKKHFVIKAGKTIAKIPIVLIRHSDLQKMSYRLKIRIVKNDFFELAEQKNLDRIIIFSDLYVKPTDWDGYSSLFGTYGQKKHQLMENAIKCKINKAFFDKLFIEDIGDFDESLLSYYYTAFKKALDEYNEKHPKNYLREEAEENEEEGKLVEFPNIYKN